ncbi:MAG: putative Ig domain-containing protein, partial [Ignavibacteriaceae bacterium]|nr:putative Ig domain-containing protein [Ignavibacteriaceae bacterium]
MKKVVLFMCFILVSLAAVNFAQETVIINDPLQGNTLGTKVGGSFSSEGYKPGIGANHILYDSPVQVVNGYAEFEIKGFSRSAIQDAEGDADNGFIGLYDGRGINEPIPYFDDFKTNFFRWNFHYRQNRAAYKAVLQCAAPTPERLNATKAVFGYDENGLIDKDWGEEPTGTDYFTDVNNWYKIRVEWNNKTFQVMINGTTVWGPVHGPYDYAPIDFKIWLGSAPGHTDKYVNSVPNIVYRNFKLVSYGAVQNTAPNIITSAITNATVGQLYSYDVNATGNPTPTYSLSNAPSGMTINSTTGVIQWTPSATGDYNVTVVASNGVSPNATQSFTITVHASTNFAPIITSTPSTVGIVGALYTYDVETDANPNPTYTLTTAPSGMTINSSTGLIQWTPSAIGSYNVTVNASNGISPDATQSFTINVQTSSTFAPVFTSTPPTTGLVGVLYSYDAETDANPDPTYSLTTAPAGMTINASTGVVQWTPSATGNYNVTIKAANGISPDATQSFTISVSSNQTSAPVITSVPDTTGMVGYLYTYNVETNGNPNPTYSLTVFPTGMTINSSTGLIQWIPTSTGIFNVTVNAANGISPDATQSFMIYVEEFQAGACLPTLLSYWKLDETSGSTYADYVGTNTATSSSAPTPTTGKVNGAQSFNGTSNGLTAGRIAAYDFALNTSFTFEAWVLHPSATYTGEEIILERKPATGNLAINLKFGSSRTATFSVRNTLGETFTVAGTKILYDGNWHHIAGVRDASTNQLKVYVDGILEGVISTTFTAGFAHATQGIAIGYRSGTNEKFFEGSIDEAAIYNVALDATTIGQHYASGVSNLGYCQVQSAPVITSTPSTSVELNHPYTYDVNADGFPDPTYSLVTSPSGMIIDTASGLIQWLPAATGDFSVTVKAANGVNPEATQSFNIHVYQVITAPSNLTAVLSPVDSHNVKLDWTDNSDNELGFIIERKLGDSASVEVYSVLDSVAADVISYEDTSVADSTLYTYRVYAYNVDTTSTFSNQAEVVSAVPVELTSFNASVANGKVTLEWETATETNNYG